ncbi:hypothetical protein MW887_001723 [Aspergillus wentii]|nr:hypothetical protein MW887_001723 [Aspergillus wentii]
MDEHSTSALQYGHVGTAIYVPETQSWTFYRSLAQPVPIHYAGSTKTIVSSPLTATQSSLPENKSQLSRVHPELAASWSFVRNEPLSHVITAASEICDPLMSSLFDLGHAVDLENDDSGSRVIPIAVTASGECGNAISFRKIEEDTVELKQETTVWTGGFAHADVTFNPWYQKQFAIVDERGNWGLWEISAGSQTSPNGAQFSTLVFKEVAHLPSSLSKKYYDRSATGLIKLFALDSHLSVRESVYVGPGAKGGEQEQLPGRDILRLKKRYPGVQRKQATQDDFIVDDWDESVLGMGTPTAPDPGSSIVTPLAIPEWTIDCTSIYAVATGKLMAVLSGMIPGHLPEKDFKVSIKELENKISKNDLRDEPTNQTMLEFLGVSPLLEDIDQSARDFERFVSVLTGQNSASQEQLQFIILPRKISPGSTEHMGLDLVNIYDSLVNDWLSNLPHDIASRTRIMKEKVIRKVTADLILSRISIIPRVMGRAKESGKDPGHGNDAKSAMPAGNASGTITQRSLSLPLATESGPGSNIISSFSHIRTDSAPGGVGSSKSESSEDSPGIPYPSLSALAAFNYEQPMSRHVTNMLSHWPPGANPDAYNWQRTVHEFENEHTQRVANSTTPRRRLRKKASQSTVLDSSATVPPVSTVPVVRDWGSQPDNEPPRLRLQSSQARDEDLPMTQIERGIFGGREAGRKPAMKARKKKRAAGF